MSKPPDFATDIASFLGAAADPTDALQCIEVPSSAAPSRGHVLSICQLGLAAPWERRSLRSACKLILTGKASGKAVVAIRCRRLWTS